MASYRTVVCDRCKAEWPLQDNQLGHNLIHYFTIKSNYGEQRLELCSPCAQDWHATLKKFKDNQ